MVVAMKKLDANAANRLKSEFVFRVADTRNDQHPMRPFRHPLGLEIAARLAARLRAEGMNVTEPKPGKACDAGFNVVFSNFGVGIGLVVSSRPGTECALLTGCYKSRWRRVSQDDAYGAWERVCGVIEQALKQEGKVISLSCMTSEEAKARSKEISASLER